LYIFIFTDTSILYLQSISN